MAYFGFLKKKIPNAHLQRANARSAHLVWHSRAVGELLTYSARMPDHIFFSDQSSVLQRLKNKQGKDSFSFNSQVCSTYIHPFQTLQFFSILQLLPNVLLNSSHSVIIVIGEVWHFWAMLPILELSTGFKMDDSSLPPRSSKPKTTFQASLFSQPQLSYCKIRVEA